MTWTIHLNDKSQERVNSAGAQLSPDGALVLMEQDGTLRAIYNARVWDKISPAAIQDGQVN